ncbi:hypothetical protein [Mesonia aquimarina]|uniref:hypothetical protein n=1 Tax=Mesonia aquimarina TaxID=1504967 RepID=UPI000EF56B46|nr:hypothetical protein [Mesonia aquimarina]
MATTIHKGELSTRGKLFKRVYTNTPTQERVYVDEFIKKIWLKQMPVSGEEDDDDGKIRSLEVLKFITHYSKDLNKNGTKYFIRLEDDGDFEIHSALPIGQGKMKRFLELKTSRKDG